jgi:starvation-inducible DNA-binding protein
VSTQETTTSVSPTEVASILQPVLVDLLALALDGKQAHWHVRGKNFKQVHEQLDELIADARNYSDDVAERVVALGAPVDGRPETVAETTKVPSFQTGFIQDEKVVAAIVEQLDAAIATARKALDALDKVDLVSQDIVIELLRALEKHRWMFEAQVVS